jgi:Leucine-rich repeat (LRR) protein
MDTKRKALGPPAADALEGEEPEKKRHRLTSEEEEIFARLSTAEAWGPYSTAPAVVAKRVATEADRMARGGRRNQLILSHCGLHALPAELGGCDILVLLDCQGCPMRAVPPELSKCKSLEWVDLTDTHVTSIPREWGNMRKLRILNLVRTDVLSLPVRLGRCKSLTMVCLTDHLIPSWPVEVREFKGLSPATVAARLKGLWQLVERKFFRALFAVKGEDSEQHLMSQLPLELKKHIYSLL